MTQSTAPTGCSASIIAPTTSASPGCGSLTDFWNALALTVQKNRLQVVGEPQLTRG
jgi:hypothetical protein